MFKLVYPRAEIEYTRTRTNPGTLSPVSMIWSQTSNPVTSERGSAVTGYRAHVVNPADHAGCGWNGLHRTSKSGGSLMSSNLDAETHYEIGAITSEDAYRLLTGGRGLFGGPCSSAYSSSQVELYVARPNYRQLAGGVTSQTSSAEQAFRIDSESGQIYTTGNGGLDHESMPLYNLVVSAYDDGAKFHGGSVNTTKTGAACMHWDDSVSTEYNPGKYKKVLSGGHNYCRNPGGGQPYSWCFRADDGAAEQ